MINCETELGLKWTKNWVISEISRKFNPVEYEEVTAITGASFQINNAKPYVLVVTLSIKITVTDIRYFTRSKFSRSLVHR